MLLRHTSSDVKERSALTVNPAKTCQPIGAMYAALGLHNCFPHSHGSQGCCAYHRSMLTRHYKEPVMAGTSSFTEGASVFGGGANLTQAIHNIFSLYDPDVIAVHTTCLSETIGDDIPQIVSATKEGGKIPDGKLVIHANTPSYVGSHVTGFAAMTKSMVSYLAESTGEKKDQVNVLPGYVEPADMAEVKRLAAALCVKSVVFPDTSGVLNAPQTGRHEFYPRGGATVEEIRSAGDSRGTLALGALASGPAGRELENKCKVPCEVLDLPIGLLATDRFVDALRKAAGVPVTEAVNVERGQVLDVMTDMHQYLFQKKVALVGDPDQLIALTEFLVTLDMWPTHIVTGTSGKEFERRIGEITKDLPYTPNVKAGGDMYLFHQWIKGDKPHVIIGNTYCKYIARDEDIPFIRHGFPIVDRIGHILFPTVGYRGALRLLEKLLDAVMDRQDRDASESAVELVM
jgi:nitrogenase molybdenum-iron protein beta chain